MKKRLLALLLSLIMIFSMLCSPLASVYADSTDVTYTKTSTVEAGKEYLIVAYSSSSEKHYAAANNDGSIEKLQVTVASNKITLSATDAAKAGWTAAAAPTANDVDDGGNLTFTNSSKYLGRSEGSLTVGDSLADYHYGLSFANGTLTNSKEGTTYYLGYGTSSSSSSTTKFKFSSSVPDDGVISFYVKGTAGGGDGETVDVTSSTKGATASAEIDVNETLTINLKNGSSNSKTYAISVEDSTVLELTDTSLSLDGSATGEAKVKGLKNGTSTVTLTTTGSGNTYSATVTVKVGNGGTTGGDTGSVTYSKTDSIEAGKEYLIVATGNSNKYALANDDGDVEKLTVTVSSDKITLSASDAAKAGWTVAAAPSDDDVDDGGDFTFANNGKYLYRSGTSSKIGSELEDDHYGFSFANGTLTNQGSSDLYYLGYSSSSFKFSTSKPDDGVMSYYVKDTTGGTTGGDTGSVTYSKTDNIEAGKEYLVVANGNSGKYALANNSGSVEKLTVTVSSDKITLSAADAAKAGWTVAAAPSDDDVDDGGDFTFANGGKYLGRSSSDVKIGSGTSKAYGLSYAESTLTNVGSSSTYYLTYSGSFAFESSKPETDYIDIYVKDATGGTTEEGDVVYVAFASDVHNSSTSKTSSNAKVLNNWLNGVSATLGNTVFADMGFCGDLGSQGAGSTEFWNYAATIMSVVEDSSVVTGNGFYVAGNHEYMNGNMASTSNSTTAKYTARGTDPVETENYIFYSVGATSTSEEYTSSDISALDTYLSDKTKAGFEGPIFILGHYPLHCYNSKSGESTSIHDGNAAKGSADLIKVLNEYPNVVFLWGHNHSTSNDHYDKVYTDKINDTAINFKYASAGCMSGIGSSIKGLGLVAKIADGKLVGLDYYGSGYTKVGTGWGNTSGTGSTTTTSTKVDITSSKDGATASVNVKVGDTLTINLTNGSSNNKKSYTVEVSDDSVLNLTTDATFELAKSASGAVKLTALKVGGPVTVTMTSDTGSGSNVYSATVTVNVVEGSTGGDPVITDSVDITSDKDGANETAEILVGDTLTINLTNGSTYGTKTYTVSVEDDTVVALTSDASFDMEASETTAVTVKGLTTGNTTVTMTAESSQSGAYTATVTIYVVDSSTVTEPSTPEGTTYLAFTSDVHNSSSSGSSGSSAARLKSWLTNVSKNLGNILFENMGFTGDSGSTNSSESNYWKYVGTVMDTVKDSKYVSGEGFFIAGNHEWQPGNLGSTTESNAARIQTNGAKVETEDYILYSFGASQYNEEFTSANISALSSYLASKANYDGTIFVLSHFPLHTFNSKTGESTDIHDGKATQGAADLIEVLNNYPNVVFLWGHNHSSSTEYYDKVTTDKIGDTPINFIYAAAGCMSDSEYSGKGSSVKGKGLVAKILEGELVSLTYYGTGYTKVGTGWTAEGVPTETTNTVDITTSKDGATASVTVKKGDTLTVNLTNGSSNEKEYAVEIEDQTVLTLNGSSPVSVDGEATEAVTFNTLAVDETTVTFSAAGYQSGTYTATVTVKVVDEQQPTVSTYSVTATGTGSSRFNGADTATKGTDYNFTLNALEGYNLSVTGMTIGGNKYTGYTESEGVYTVPGADIIGNIKVTVTQLAVSTDFVNVTFAGDTIGMTVPAAKNADYSFILNKETGVTYTVTAANAAGAVDVMENGNSHTVVAANMGEDVTITIIKGNQSAPAENTVSVSFTGAVVDVTDGATVATRNTAYKFTVNKASGYNYTVTATVGGANVSLSELNGTYTIAANKVTGNIIINIAKSVAETPTPVDNTVAVSFTGATSDVTSGAATATKNVAYSFTVNKAAGYDYTVTATVGGANVALSQSGNTYSIAANKVTDNIVINISKVAQSTPTGNTVSVTFTGAAEDATGAATATKNTDYTFTVNKASGYTYTVTATVDGKSVSVTNNYYYGSSYTIAAASVTGDIVINVAKVSWYTPVCNTVSVTFTGATTDVTSGAATATKNVAYSFTVNKAYGYTYTVTATVGGASVSVSELNGTYTIAANKVTGNIVINIAKTSWYVPVCNTVSVTFTGASGDATGAATATKNTAYTFTVNKVSGYNYTVTATVNGNAVGVSSNYYGNSYTIAAANVTGNIVINIAKVAQYLPVYNTVSVTFTGASGDATGAATATKGAAYSFTVNKVSGYNYTVTATVNGIPVTLSQMYGTYYIAANQVTGNIVINIAKVSQYAPIAATVSVNFVGATGDVTYGPKTAVKNWYYSFKVNKVSGYNYTVTATVGGKAIPLYENNGTYSIAAANVTGDITVYVVKLWSFNTLAQQLPTAFIGSGYGAIYGLS